MIEVIAPVSMGMGGNSGGSCDYRSAFGQLVMDRMGVDIGLKVQAKDLASQKTELHENNPIELYFLKVGKASFVDKVTGKKREELTLISPDFNNEPIGVWTGAGKINALGIKEGGTDAEYTNIINWAHELAAQKEQATLLWISPGGKKAEGLEHRAFVLKKDSQDNIQAVMYQLTGEKESLVSLFEELGGKNGVEAANLGNERILLTGKSFNISHEDFFQTYAKTVDQKTYLSHSDHFARFRHEASEVSDMSRWEKVNDYRASFEAKLKQNYQGDIQKALESVVHGFLATSAVFSKYYQANKETDVNNQTRSLIADAGENRVFQTTTLPVNPRILPIEKAFSLFNLPDGNNEREGERKNQETGKESPYRPEKEQTTGVQNLPSIIPVIPVSLPRGKVGQVMTDDENPVLNVTTTNEEREGKITKETSEAETVGPTETETMADIWITAMVMLGVLGDNIDLQPGKEKEKMKIISEIRVTAKDSVDEWLLQSQVVTSEWRNFLVDIDINQETKTKKDLAVEIDSPDNFTASSFAFYLAEIIERWGTVGDSQGSQIEDVPLEILEEEIISLGYEASRELINPEGKKEAEEPNGSLVSKKKKLAILLKAFETKDLTKEAKNYLGVMIYRQLKIMAETDNLNPTLRQKTRNLMPLIQLLEEKLSSFEAKMPLENIPLEEIVFMLVFQDQQIRLTGPLFNKEGSPEEKNRDLEEQILLLIDTQEKSAHDLNLKILDVLLKTGTKSYFDIDDKLFKNLDIGRRLILKIMDRLQFSHEVKIRILKALEMQDNYKYRDYFPFEKLVGWRRRNPQRYSQGKARLKSNGIIYQYNLCFYNQGLLVN